VDAADILIYSWRRTRTLLPGHRQEQTTGALGIAMGIHDLCLEQISMSVMVARWE
jgi:hypothetical protein